MRPEVKRILKLVEEGKLSSDDAAELIEAFDDGPSAPPAEPPSEEPKAAANEEATDKSSDEHKNAFEKLIESIERLSKEVSTSVDWNAVARQARENAQKGLDAVKSGVEQVTRGRIDLGWMTGGESKDVELPLSVPAGKTLRIENPCGDVRIKAGPSMGRVMAHAKFKGATPEDAKAKSQAYVLMIEESDTAVVIRQPDMSGLQVDLDIEAISEAPLEIRAASGDLEIRDMKGGVKINSKSGDVTLKSVEGPVEISTASGDLTVEDAITSSLSYDGKSGDVRLTRVHGNMNLRTASGDVQIRGGNSRTLSVECVSGDCDIELDVPVVGSVSVRTVSGDALVKVPAGSDCRVSVSTLRGAATVRAELEDEAKAEQRVTGKLGEGSGSLDISAVTGDVTFEVFA